MINKNDARFKDEELEKISGGTGVNTGTPVQKFQLNEPVRVKKTGKPAVVVDAELVDGRYLYYVRFDYTSTDYFKFYEEELEKVVPE